jgi:hypothetical protein
MKALIWLRWLQIKHQTQLSQMIKVLLMMSEGLRVLEMRAGMLVVDTEQQLLPKFKK